MEPSQLAQICLPRFDSNRQAFELPARMNVPESTEKVEEEKGSVNTKREKPSGGRLSATEHRAGLPQLGRFV